MAFHWPVPNHFLNQSWLINDRILGVNCSLIWIKYKHICQDNELENITCHQWPCSVFTMIPCWCGESLHKIGDCSEVELNFCSQLTIWRSHNYHLNTMWFPVAGYSSLFSPTGPWISSSQHDIGVCMFKLGVSIILLVCPCVHFPLEIT